jgi:diguanylate cyclase (GGDEF)-like protein/PAS domain S-box-containing protein
MSLAAVTVFWVTIAIWIAVMAALWLVGRVNPAASGTARLLTALLAVAAACGVAQSLLGGLSDPTARPAPAASIVNLAAACIVLAALLLRGLPRAARERSVTLAAERRQSKLTLELEQSRRLFETSLDLILITDRRGKLLRVSPSSLPALGYRPEEMVGHLGGDFIYPDDLDLTRMEMRLARRGRHMRNFECRYVHRDGHVVPFAWSGVWSEPEQRHYFIGRDISERRAAEERLHRLALFDQLTGLPNRASLREDLARLLEQDIPVAVALIDLDGFKDINDTLGHSVGDRLLVQVAQRLCEACGNAQVYRPGGDEFVLVLRDCRDASTMAERTHRTLRALTERCTVEEHNLFISASAGIAMAPADATTVEELLSGSELALYDAKAAGGRTHRSFEPGLRARAETRRGLDAELRRACANGEFELHFQPQVSASAEAVVGAEALLRWRHPERGLLSPAVFLDTLAESAVAPEVGRWILEDACATAARWRARHGPIRVAVNLFPAQFRSGTLLTDVEQALAASGLPEEALELEITENIALHRDDSVLAPLRTLRARGVGIAFDDFGTGYASLSYLTRYPLTRIKIDRSFVQKISEHATREDTAIVRSIIAMGSNLGLEVTAEGVETPAQRSFLAAQGCDDLQGYLFSRPLPARDFDAFLDAWASRVLQRASCAGARSAGPS